MVSEREIMKSVIQRLGVYNLTGECCWYGRLQSLKVKTLMGSWIQGCPKGTPDILAIIRNRQDGITALFLECKSDTGQLRREQRDFMEKYNRKPGFCVLMVNDPSQIDKWIDKNAKDFTEFLPTKL